MSQPNMKIAKTLNILAFVASAIVVLLVVFMRKIHLDFGMSFGFLPPIYSAFNAFTAVTLIYAYSAIKKKNVKAHQNAINLAMSFSVAFLLMYVLYHITTPDTKFCKTGWIRPVYFTILISHIILAATILPLILFTYIRAYTGQIESHRKMAKWVFPIWLYVAATGPIIYLLLKDCYQY